MGLLGAVRRRPRGRPAGCRRGRRADAGHPGRRARRRVQRRRQLGAVVRPPHAVPDPAGAGLRRGVPAAVDVVRAVQPGVRRGAGRGGGARCDGRGAGLPPDAGAGHAPRAAAGPEDRALLAHAVGAARVLPDAAGRRGRAGAARHAGRGPAGLSHAALGGRVRRMRRAVRGRGRGHADRRARAGCRRGLPAAAVAREGRRGADGRAARGDRRGPPHHRPGRPHRAVEEHRARSAGVPAAARRPPRVARARGARGLRVPLTAGPRGVPGVHGRGAAGLGGDQRRVRDPGVDPGRTEPQGRLRSLPGRVPAGRRRARQPDPRRHEPRRQGGPRRLRRGLRPGAVAGGRGARGAGRGRDHGEPVRRDRHGGGPARGALDGPGGTRRARQAPGSGGDRAAMRRSGSWTSSTR